MKKQLLSLGKVLDKAKQKTINGGGVNQVNGWCDGDANNYGLPCGCACITDSNCIMGYCDKGPYDMLIWGVCCG